MKAVEQQARMTKREVLIDDLWTKRSATAADPGGLAGWVLRMMRPSEAKTAARHMRVVETMALGGRRQLILVECDGQKFLVGSGTDRVDTIVEVRGGTRAAEETWLS